jgi:hypothetical protein
MYQQTIDTSLQVVMKLEIGMIEGFVLQRSFLVRHKGKGSTFQEPLI